MDEQPTQATQLPQSVPRRKTVSVSKWAAAGTVLSIPVLTYLSQTYFSKDAGNALTQRVEQVEQTYLRQSESNKRELKDHMDKVADRITEDFRRDIKALEERTLRAETQRDDRIERNRARIEELFVLVGRPPKQSSIKN